MKKKYTKLITERGVNGFITYNEGNCNHLYVLSWFLEADIRGESAAEFYIDWLNDKFDCPVFTTNTHHLEISGGDFIITDIFINDEDEPNDLYFKTSKKYV